MKKLEELKTFEDACQVEGLEAEKILAGFDLFPELDKKTLIACAKLLIIARAANRLANDGNEWKPDWNNSSKWKYYPWFDMRGGSSGFRFGGCGNWASASGVGSRLCFISYEVAEYVGKQFQDIYRDYMVIE